MSTESVDLEAIRRRHAEYDKAWSDPANARPSPTLMALAACSSANDVPALLAALKIERAVGWREAIEALRTGEPYPSMSRVHVSAFVRMQLADFLESLAPKETP